MAKSAPIKFINLHHHTTMSHGDGYGTPAQHAERAAELGYSAAAVTEHGGVSSFFQHEKACKKAGVKPIFGLEAYCGAVDETRSQWKYHLTILAASAEGYRSLNRIVTQSWLDYYYHPTVSWGNLSANPAGIMVLSGCSGSLLACKLLGGKGTEEHLDTPDWNSAEEVIWHFKDLLGDRYFLEIQPFYELDKTRAMNQAYVKLGKITSTPLVVTHDVHYPRMRDAEMQAVLHTVHRGKHSVDDMMRSWNYDVPLTLPESDRELADRIQKTGISRNAAWDAIEQSAVIGDMCNVTLPKADRLHYPISEQDMVAWLCLPGR